MGKRDERRAQRREEILAAAREIIEAGDLEALSMRRLALVSGCAVNTIYSLFATKEDVIAAVVTAGVDETRARLDAAALDSPLEAIDFLIALSGERLRTESTRARAMYLALVALPEAARAAAHHGAATLGALMDAAARAGILREGLDHTALAARILERYVQLGTWWAQGLKSADEVERELRVQIYLTLAAVATDEHRSSLQARLLTGLQTP